jgi:hypothetical protein
MGIFDAITGAITGGLNYENQIAAEKIQQTQFNEQLDFQKTEATQGIQQKVADAKAAGINPLAALGASTFSPSPISTGVTAPQLDLGHLGQNIDDIVGKTADTKARSDALDLSLKQAQIDQIHAETAKTASDAARALGAPGQSPHGTQATNPLFETYTDKGGAQWTLLSKNASQAVMNSASLPMAIPLGAGLIGANVGHALDSIGHWAAPYVGRAAQQITIPLDPRNVTPNY